MLHHDPTSEAKLTKQNFDNFVDSFLWQVGAAGDSLKTKIGQLFDEAYAQGVFDKVFPGFSLMDGCDQGAVKHMEGDVLAHTKEVLLAVAERIANLSGPLREDRESKELLICAALIHDIEKPHTRKELDLGDVAFPGHEKKAGERVPKLGERIGLSTNQIDRLEWLVTHHGDFYGLDKLDLNQKREFYSHPDFELALLFYECDCQAFWMSSDGENRRIPATSQILAERENIIEKK